MRRGLVLAALALVLGTVGARSRELGHGVHPQRRLHLRHDNFSPLVIIPERRLPRLLDQPDVPLMPLPPPRGPVEAGSPLPSGFTMTLVRGAEDPPASDAELGRPREVARKIAACWSPPIFDGPPAEISLRLQFSKAGQVIGKPRVTYVAAP